MHIQFVKRIVFTGLLSAPILFPLQASAQQENSDTLNLSIQEAEHIFIRKNLTLLVNQYNIDINKALVQQAKVWDNPTLIADQNIYDGKFFRHKTENGQQYGQVYIQVQQLIKTAGKIKKQTQLAQDNVLSAEAQFGDIMRNLKFILTTDLNNLAQLQNSASVYRNEMLTMQSLATGMDEMFKLGDISQKEDVRIKALLFSLQKEYNDNMRQQYDLQKGISSFLQSSDSVWIVSNAEPPFSKRLIDNLNITSLQDSALQFRPDLSFSKAQSQLQQHNINYQKALAKPDFSVGVEYDKLNSYAPNYYGLTLSAPLPLFNRNKGNIAAAEYAYKQSNTAVQQAQNLVEKEVVTAWRKLNNTTSMLTNDNAQLQNNYDVLLRNMVDSYRQRRVSLIEFIDFFDAYKETRINQWQLITDQRNAVAELNYVTNQNIFKL